MPCEIRIGRAELVLEKLSLSSEIYKDRLRCYVNTSSKDIFVSAVFLLLEMAGTNKT